MKRKSEEIEGKKKEEERKEIQINSTTSLSLLLINQKKGLKEMIEEKEKKFKQKKDPILKEEEIFSKFKLLQSQLKYDQEEGITRIESEQDLWNWMNCLLFVQQNSFLNQFEKSFLKIEWICCDEMQSSLKLISSLHLLRRKEEIEVISFSNSNFLFTAILIESILKSKYSSFDSLFDSGEISTHFEEGIESPVNQSNQEKLFWNLKRILKFILNLKQSDQFKEELWMRLCKIQDHSFHQIISFFFTDFENENQSPLLNVQSSNEIEMLGEIESRSSGGISKARLKDQSKFQGEFVLKRFNRFSRRDSYRNMQIEIQMMK